MARRRSTEKMTGPASEEAFGGVAEAFRLDNAHRLLVRGLDKASLAVTEVRNDRANFGLTEPMPYADAYMLGVQIRALQHHELWFDQRPMDVRDVAAGDSLFYDLRRNPRAYVVDRSHSIHFVLTRAFLDEITEELDAAPFDELHKASGVPVRDRTLARFGKAAMWALSAPDEVNELYASHLMISLGVYVACTYSGLRQPGAASGLSQSELLMAQEWIRANLSGAVELRDLARLCQQPATRFAAAFRQSVGMAPYQWLQIQRIELARRLLGTTDRSIIDIARLCGFTDAGHFRRVFSSGVGVTPALFRSQCR